MRIVTEENIAKVSFFLTMVVISVITFGVGAYFVVTKFEISQRELGRLETVLIDQQKQELEADVTTLQVRIESLSRSLQEVRLDQLESTAAGQETEAAPVAQFLQQKVIEELGWADDLAADSYFIYQLHDLSGGSNFATMLFNPARPDLVGQQLSTDFPDAKGHDFRKVFMKDIRDRGESFVSYWYNKAPTDGMEGAESGRKLAYFKLDPDWNWIVAKSVYLDSIDLILEQRRAALKQGILIDLAVLAAFFLGSVVLAFFLAYSFSVGVNGLLKKHRETERQQAGELENLSKTIEEQNKSDRLTGAYNRAHLNDELAKEQARSDRYLTPLSLIVFDVDYFRAINDRLGRSAGDSVLTELAAMVKDNIRKTDIFARWGSEEFAILAPGIDLDQGRMFAEKLRMLVEEYGFSVKEKVTCSFGASFYRPSESSEDFVQRADAALQRAKKEGRNRCVALE
jgi:diguanylate cyclase (GGDEF)-like protein